MFSDYLKEKKKVSGKRKRKLKSDVGTNTIALKYKKDVNALSDTDFRNVINCINNMLVDDLVSGKDVVLPFKLGRLEVRKFPTRVKIVDGKLKNSMPIDWNETLKLWYDNKSAEKKKILVRHETNYIYRIVYNKFNARYTNQNIYKFVPSRGLKIKLKESIKNGLDAFMY